MRRPAALRHLAPSARLGSKISFGNLRHTCAAASVPLQDADGWALRDDQVAMAVQAARTGDRLIDGAVALMGAVSMGHVRLGSRVLAGRMTWPEVLTLASVVRSPVADEAMS